ncbi:MAG: precorrin-6Y C5,15-methyltransferase (decarboxylating) [Rhodomicrobium sp.]|nr:MAG: precorrin-6Y C5,15-methyltransferase (decarboxylating) [Rhodomicrobium sp.]
MTDNNSTASRHQTWLTVIGIGLEGAEALGPRAKSALQSAKRLYAGDRQLNLIPEAMTPAAKRCPWPSPMMPAVAELLNEKPDHTVILASGDPLCWGIGQHLVSELQKEELLILPAPSIITLVSAVMGWPTAEVKSLSLCSQPLHSMARHLAPGAQLILLPSNRADINEVGSYLTNKGYGASSVTLIENLGSESETHTELKATELTALEKAAALTSLAITLKQDATALRLTSQPGLPDEAFEHDGQMTRQNMRAIVMAHLRPGPSEILWDIGAGSGSISIEWCRAAETARAIAVEQNTTRSARIQRNANILGVTNLEICEGSAPDILKNLETPDAIFIGGGVTAPSLLTIALEKLNPGGRLVANSVTIEGEALLISAYCQNGGSLTRFSQESASPVGRFNGWRPKMPITQWVFHKQG